MTDNALRKMLSLLAKYGQESDLLWSEDLDFAIIANDMFVPAADGVDIITDNDVLILEKCAWSLESTLPGSGKYLTHLYCLRKVRRSFQNPDLSYYPPEIHHLFREFDPVSL